MPDNILQDTIEIKHNNEVFIFRIPSYFDELKIGARERDIRREISQEVGGDISGNPDGLDSQTFFMIQTAARFEILLQKADCNWVYSPGEDGRPTIDYKKWPKDKVGDIVSIGVRFTDELTTFRSGRLRDPEPSSSEAMAGQPDPQPQPV